MKKIILVLLSLSTCFMVGFAGYSKSSYLPIIGLKDLNSNNPEVSYDAGPYKQYYYYNDSMDLDSLMNASIESLSSVDNIGEVMANAIYNFFKEEKNIELINKLKSYGLNTLNLNKKNVDVNSYFASKTIVLTGTLSFIGRTEASTILENECGAKMSNSVSKKTDLVIVGDNPGSKYEKAVSLNIQLMDEEEFHNKLVEEGKILM